MAPVSESPRVDRKADSSYFLGQPEIKVYQDDHVAPAAQEELMYRLLVGEIAGQRGHFDIAVENMLVAANQTDNPQVVERLVRICIYAKNIEKGRAAAQRWLELEPEHEEALQIAAGLALKAGDFNAALTYAQHIVALDKTAKGDSFLMIARLLSTEENESAVLKLMGLLVDEHQRNPYAVYAYGSLAMHFKQYESAKHLLKSALTLKPDLYEAIAAQARVMQLLGETEQAIVYLGEALQRYPDIEILPLAYGRLLVSAKHYEAAIKQYEQLLLASPYDDEILYTLALLTLDLKRLDSSEDYLNRLLQLGSRLQEADYYLGRIAEIRQHYKEAIGYYVRITHGEYHMDAQTRIAFMLGKLGEIEQARRHLQGLRGMSSEASMQLRYFLAEGEILRENRLYAEAMHVLTQGLIFIPENTELLYARALVAEKLDKLEMAEQDLREILLREPENADVLNALGYTLADRTNRHEEAYQLVSEAMRLKPNDAAITDSFGWVLYHLGRYAEAIRYLRKALLLQHDPEIAAHLGEVLWVNGDQDTARETWSKALKETPNHEVLLKIMQRFEQ